MVILVRVNRCSELNVVGKELGKLPMLMAHRYIDPTLRVKGLLSARPSVKPL